LSSGPRISRRAAVATIAGVALFPRRVQASELSVPVQSDLLLKVAVYDKNLAARAGDQVRVLVIQGRDDASSRWAEQVANALRKTESVAGIPKTQTIATYAGASNLAATCRADRIAIVFLAAELRSEVANLREALDGVNVLSAMPDADAVQRGIVLGFEAIYGKPKLFCNLRQAARQNVAMSSDVLKLMTVYQ
jgi:hypothetical protein